MYGTIEPRLIALLNDEPLEASPSAPAPSFDLPPLHDSNVLKPASRLYPLEPDGSLHSEKPKVDASVSKGPIPKPELIPKARTTLSKSTGNAAVLRTRGTASESLRKILDDDTELPQHAASKRQVVEGSKDSLQLPQPPKKQKTVQQVVPPIIIGLFEPPPNAALFPPIAASSFHDSRGRNTLNVTPPEGTATGTAQQVVDASSKPAGEQQAQTKRGPAVKRRRKWDDEETNHLLLGVHKYGVGRWTKILQDPEFKFNDRKAVDLKDRFRTCCPDELRGKEPSSSSPPTSGNQDKTGKSKSRSSLLTENILIDDEYSFFDESSNSDASVDEPPEKPRKSRAHRKKMEDLVELGIDGPFKKSSRRQRRAFTDQEDRNILLGYEKYGPAWTLIQRDPALGLQSRRPTDIRDRLRNKDPVKFKSLKEARKAPKESTEPAQDMNAEVGKADVQELIKPIATGGTKEPIDVARNTASPTSSNHMPMGIQGSTSKSVSNAPMAFNFRDLFSDLGDPNTADPLSQPFDWNAQFTTNIGDMDISRLLLDDSWSSDFHNTVGSSAGNTGSVAHASSSTAVNVNGGVNKQKQTYTDINSICTTSNQPIARNSSASKFFLSSFEAPSGSFDGDAGFH